MAIRKKSVAVPSEECASYLKALGDEKRWKLVELLMLEPSNVSKLAEQLELSQSHMSKQLAVLREAGIVVTERVGKQVIASVNPAYRSQSGRVGLLSLGCCEFDFGCAGSG